MTYLRASEFDKIRVSLFGKGWVDKAELRRRENSSCMDVRLVQLLGSFIGARSQYSLARLEFALHYPRSKAPPVIGRLAEPSERALREEWPLLEKSARCGAPLRAKAERRRRRKLMKDEAYRWLQRSLREMDQYARAIRWVLTVTDARDSPASEPEADHHFIAYVECAFVDIVLSVVLRLEPISAPFTPTTKYAPGRCSCMYDISSAHIRISCGSTTFSAPSRARPTSRTTSFMAASLTVVG